MLPSMVLSGRTLRLCIVLIGLAILVGATGILAWAWRPVTNIGEHWRADRMDSDDAADELVRLREDRAWLNARNVVLTRRLREYENLADRLGGGAADGLQMVRERVLLRARITSRTRRKARHYATIDAGLVDGDGVVRGLGVVCGQSLVGVVAGEQAGRSLVQLVTDKLFRIPASLVLTDDAGKPIGEVLGVCAGTGQREALHLLFIEDQGGLVVKSGLEVVTAPGREHVPPGLVLGIVDTATQEPHSDHWSISVRPLRSVDQVSTVLVLRGARIAGPADVVDDEPSVVPTPVGDDE